LSARPETEAVEQTQGAIALLAEQLEAVTQRLDTVPTSQTVDLSGMEQAIADIQGQLNSLNQQLNARTETEAIEQTQGAIALLAEQLEAVTQRLDTVPTSQTVDLSGVEQAIAGIQQHLDTLDQQLNARTETEAVEQTQGAIALLAEQLEAITQRLDSAPTPQTVDLSGVEQAIADIQGQLNRLNQQFNARTESEAIEQTQGAIALLAEQLEAITQRLDSAPTPQAVDLSGVEQAIAGIQERVDTIDQQFNTRSETEAIEQTQGAIALLAEQLEAITQRLDSAPTPQTVDLSGVEQAISGIQQRLDTQLAEELITITQRLDSAPTPQTVDLSGVEQAIAGIQQRLETIDQQFNARTESEAIEQTQSAIALLAEQLEAVTQRLDSTPTPQTVDLSGVEQAISGIQQRLETIDQQFNARTESEAIEQTQSAIALLAEQLEAVTQRLDSAPTPQTVDLSGVEQAISGIQQRLETIDQQFNARTESEAIEQTQSAIALLAEQLEAVTQRLDSAPTPQTVDLSGVEQAISGIQQRLETIDQQFNARTESEAIEQTQSAIALLAEQLEAVTQRLDSAPTSETSPAVDFSGFEQAVIEIGTQLDELRQRVDHLSPPEAIQLREEVFSADAQNQQEVIASFFDVDELPLSIPEPLPILEKAKPSEETAASTPIEGPLGELIQRFQERPETQAVKQVQNKLEQLTERLITVALRLGQLKMPSDVNISGMRQALAETQGQMDIIYQQFKARPETEAIEQLEGAIAQFSEVDFSGDEEAAADLNFQVDAMALCLENLPAPIEFDLSGIEQAIANLETQANALAKGSSESVAASSTDDIWNDAGQPSTPHSQTPSVGSLEKAIALLKEELNAAIFYLENLPEQGADLWGDEDEIANLQW
jgi:DNA repair exonuclease SbcCD ATPase subunit